MTCPARQIRSAACAGRCSRQDGATSASTARLISRHGSTAIELSGMPNQGLQNEPAGVAVPESRVRSGARPCDDGWGAGTRSGGAAGQRLLRHAEGRGHVSPVRQSTDIPRNCGLPHAPPSVECLQHNLGCAQSSTERPPWTPPYVHPTDPEGGKTSFPRSPGPDRARRIPRSISSSPSSAPWAGKDIASSRGSTTSETPTSSLTTLMQRRSLLGEAAIPLEPEELAALTQVARLGQSAAEPALCGHALQCSLASADHAQPELHLTGRADILLVVEPVVLTPLRRRSDMVWTYDV